MTHLSDIKKIVSEYSRIKQSLAVLDEQTKLLALQKNHIEFQLAQVREAETDLIDRIKAETGEEPDFYKIMQQLGDEAITIH